MFSHLLLGARDPDASRQFYDAVLGALSVAPAFSDAQGRHFWRHGGSTLGVGRPLDGQAATSANGNTLGLAAQSPEQVDAAHAAGLAAGGSTCEDPPGWRDRGGANGRYYAAYLRDPDGHKLGLIHRPAKAS